VFFVLDEDVPHAVAALLRQQGFEVQSAKELGRLGVSDVQVLLQAALDDQIVVTHNGRDFELLHEAWITWGRQWEREVAAENHVKASLSHHAGILITPHLPNQAMVDVMASFVGSYGPIAGRLLVWSAATGWRESRREPRPMPAAQSSSPAPSPRGQQAQAT